MVSATAARALVEQTGCNGVMVGRGAVQDPLIFRRIRAAHGCAESAVVLQDEVAALHSFLRAFAANLAEESKVPASPHTCTGSSPLQACTLFRQLRTVLALVYNAITPAAATLQPAMTGHNMATWNLEALVCRVWAIRHQG